MLRRENKRINRLLFFPGLDPKECKDLEDGCKTWVGNGDCIRLPDYMSQNCKKTCEMCGSGKNSNTTQLPCY